MIINGNDWSLIRIRQEFSNSSKSSAMEPMVKSIRFALRIFLSLFIIISFITIVYQIIYIQIQPNICLQLIFRYLISYEYLIITYNVLKVCCVVLSDNHYFDCYLLYIFRKWMNRLFLDSIYVGINFCSIFTCVSNQVFMHLRPV